MGRPLKYQPEELEQKIEEYFKKCETEKKIPLEGMLCLFLGIDVSTWDEWKENEKKGFSLLVKKADERIIALKEHALVHGQGNTIGLLASLKRHDPEWREKHQSGGIFQGVNLFIGGQSAEEIQDQIEELEQKKRKAIEGTRQIS